MAEATGLLQSTISRVWRAFGVRPHGGDIFELSHDSCFIDKVRDAVSLYMAPPERAIVLCVNGKCQMQALDRTQPLLPMVPGQAERQTLDDVRQGTSLFAALNVVTGEVIGKCRRRHWAKGFLRFLDEVHPRVPHDPGVEIHQVLDNDTTHKTPAVNCWFLRHPENRLHLTPTNGSWLNRVEPFFAEITERRIRRGASGAWQLWRWRSGSTWSITTPPPSRSCGPPTPT